MKHDDAPVMLWTARPDLGCESVSTAWLDFTGYDLEQALGDGWTRAVHPEDLARLLDTYVRAFDAKGPFELEYRLRRKDAEYRWVLDRGRPRFAPDGLFLGYSGACVDIDERRRLQDKLARCLERERRARIAADECSRMKDGFIGSVLRELLPATQAMATWATHLRERLAAGSDDARAAEAFVENARAQARIIGNLLAFSGNAVAKPSAEEPLLTGVRVLVVEDQPQLRDILMKVLSVAGAETRAVASAAEALDALAAWDPDVLLSDLALQGEDGYSLIRALRSRPAEEGGCLRAAALTSDDDAPRRSRLSPVAAGYDAALAKPIEPVALLTTVARLAHPASV